MAGDAWLDHGVKNRIEYLSNSERSTLGANQKYCFAKPTSRSLRLASRESSVMVLKGAY